MKITLQRLTLEHFKGIANLTLDFDGGNATIYGDNGSGKTTVYDAYLWLLTGRDSLGHADFDIKPLDRQGCVADHGLRSAVEAVLAVDGGEITLRREFYELWSRKRGRTEATYDGNSTDYYIDGVPKAKRAYEEAVSALVPLDKLRLLSDTTAFAALPWKQRRDILFDLADLGTDLELMGSQTRYTPLLDAAGKLGLDDLRAQLKARRKKVNGRLNDLPLLIAENRKAIDGLGDVPFGAIRASLADLEEDEHRLTGEITSVSAGDTAALQNRLDALRNELTALEQENRQHRWAQESSTTPRRDLEQTVTAAEGRIRRCTEDYKRQSGQYHELRKVAQMHEDNAQDYRRLWLEEADKAFDGSATCPTCGQTLPPEMQEEARRRWEQEHADRLRQLQGLGTQSANHARQMQESVQSTQDAMAATEGEIARTKQELADARAALDAAEEPEITSLPGYAVRKHELEADIREAETALSTAKENVRAQEASLRKKRQTVREEMDGLRRQLAKEETLRTLGERITELEQERRDLAEELAQIDRLTDLADDFVRYKGEYVTDAVNGRFRLAQFRLFAEQVNGETPPACDILCGGVPFDSGLNNGARINTGLDIIATLSRYYDISVPVFVDNAESVVQLLDIDTQVIRLVVSGADKKVRMEQ